MVTRVTTIRVLGGEGEGSVSPQAGSGGPGESRERRGDNRACSTKWVQANNTVFTGHGMNWLVYSSRAVKAVFTGHGMSGVGYSSRAVNSVFIGHG